MPPRSTRSKGGPPKSSETSTPAASSQTNLPTPDLDPPHLFILPKDVSAKARFVSIRSCVTESLERYLYCPQTGIYELKSIPAASQGPARSLLLSGQDAPAEREQTQAYVLRNADFLTATKLDPLFLLMPLFHHEATEIAATRNKAQVEDEHWEKLGQSCSQIAILLRHIEFRQLLRARLAAVSTTIEMGDEKVYQLSIAKLSQHMESKIEAMMAPDSWPASLEEAQVRKRLELPRAATRTTFVRQADSDLQENPTYEDGSKLLTDSQGECQDATPTVNEEVRLLARRRTAQDFLLRSYVPKSLHAELRKHFTVNFGLLEEHLTQITKLKAEAQALQSMSDNISRKRSGAEDEAVEMRAEKRRKKEEEELKKKNESRAAKQLKKVDTSGMKKMSAFFAAKAKWRS